MENGKLKIENEELKIKIIIYYQLNKMENGEWSEN
jgi:hypothetical protein